jgi:hypothetical protein
VSGAADQVDGTFQAARVRRPVSGNEFTWMMMGIKPPPDRLAGSASRDFGIDEQKSAGQIQSAAGQAKAFSTGVKGAYYVRLRLVCEKPGGLMILRQGKLAAS